MITAKISPAIKWLNLLFAALFIFSAIIQYNDPDPVLWILLYGYGAFLSLMAFRGKFSRLATGLGLLVYSIYAIYLFFVTEGVADWLQKHNAASITGSMKAESEWIENTREFFGLFIMIIILAINYIYFQKKHRSRI